MRLPPRGGLDEITERQRIVARASCRVIGTAARNSAAVYFPSYYYIIYGFRKKKSKGFRRQRVGTNGDVCVHESRIIVTIYTLYDSGGPSGARAAP